MLRNLVVTRRLSGILNFFCWRRLLVKPNWQVVQWPLPNSPHWTWDRRRFLISRRTLMQKQQKKTAKTHRENLSQYVCRESSLGGVYVSGSKEGNTQIPWTPLHSFIGQWTCSTRAINISNYTRNNIWMWLASVFFGLQLGSSKRQRKVSHCCQCHGKCSALHSYEICQAIGRDSLSPTQRNDFGRSFPGRLSKDWYPLVFCFWGSQNWDKNRKRNAGRLGLKCEIHPLRHYNYDISTSHTKIYCITSVLPKHNMKVKRQLPGS